MKTDPTVDEHVLLQSIAQQTGWGMQAIKAAPRQAPFGSYFENEDRVQQWLRT